MEDGDESRSEYLFIIDLPIYLLLFFIIAMSVGTYVESHTKINTVDTIHTVHKL